MKALASFLMVILAGLSLAGCGGDSNESPGERPGSSSVYARIQAETDCATLQREFDTAMDNTEAREPGDPQREVSLSYADAADARMQQVGCYG